MKSVRDLDKQIFKKVCRTSPSTWQYLTVNPSLNTRYKKEDISLPEVDRIVENLKAKIKTKYRGTVALYLPEADIISMPHHKYFRQWGGLTREQNYYSTLFHEIIHWTGNKKRLNRSSLRKMDESIEHLVIEEIVAEMGSSQLLRYFGICQKMPKQSLSYIQYYLSKLPEEKREKCFSKAAILARKSIRYVINNAGIYV